MKPMLAHIYEPKRFQTPCYVQPKLDGVRGLTQHGHFFSRDEVEWSPVVVGHIAPSLIYYEEILDGEWYRHGWSLQKVNGAIAVNRTVRVTNTDEIAFNVFDMVDFNLSFIERWWKAKEIVAAANNKLLRIVPVHEVTTKTEIEHWFSYYRKLGYEGVMVRMGDQGYTRPHNIGGTADQDNRCWTMLKRKGWLDDEFEIIGVQEGKETDRGSKYVGKLGALICVTKDGKQFTVGSGMSDYEREEWWDEPPVKHQAKVKFETLSDAGIPLKPTLLTVL